MEWNDPLRALIAAGKLEDAIAVLDLLAERWDVIGSPTLEPGIRSARNLIENALALIEEIAEGSTQEPENGPRDR